MFNSSVIEEEFSSRIQKVQKLLQNDQRDGILVFSTESEPYGVRYFADYWPSFETTGVLIPREGEVSLLIGPESLTYAKGHSKVKNIIRMKDFRESSQPDYPGSKLATWEEVLAQHKIKKSCLKTLKRKYFSSIGMELLLSNHGKSFGRDCRVHPARRYDAAD